jgi:hypothetical protein
MEEKIAPSHWVMDYETIINCFIGVFTHYKNESVKHVFIINKDRNDLAKLVSFFKRNIKEKEWHISFNGLAFDAQITQFIIDKQDKLLILSGEKVADILYKYAQSVIDKSNNHNGFLDYSPKQLKIRQIDLFKMNHWDNKAKMSGLKWIQYSMDWNNVEEMPHYHYEPITTDEELKKVVSYCVNDVLSTKAVLEYSKEQIQLRQSLTAEYNIDLYSASEPRISKELFLHFLEQKLGWEKSTIKKLRTPRTHIVLADCILPYIDFKTEEFQKILKQFRQKVITSTKDGFKFTADYKGVKTDYGLGGIHGAAPSGVYEAKPGFTIMTSDVTSFYPNLAIKNGFHPEHLPQQEFCELYEWIFEERKKIPKSNPKNYVYKIILNSTYGLTGDENSFLYDPKMTMQITVNGQLSLTMLYEMISEEIPFATPLMQNTDGLETMIPVEFVDRYYEICARWERLTKLSLEHDEYSKMIIRDVNNYIAINKEGKVKCKGAFEWEDLDKKKVATFHKNKSFLIIPKAIYAYFVNKIKPEDYLTQHSNFLDYCGAVKAKGYWKINELTGKDGMITKKELQKIVRYFISNTGSKLVKCHPDGREIQVEAGQPLQTVVNKIESTDLKDYDINYKYYLNEIYKQIQGIEKESSGTVTQLQLF